MKRIYICITESRCCMAESKHNILYQLYFNEILKIIIHLQKICETAPFWRFPKPLQSALLMNLVAITPLNTCCFLNLSSQLHWKLLECVNIFFFFFTSPVCSTAPPPQKLSFICKTGLYSAFYTLSHWTPMMTQWILLLAPFLQTRKLRFRG